MPGHREEDLQDDFWPNISSDLAAIRKLLEEGDGDETCPSCGMPFDKGKKRKLIDSCGHERCYSCMFRNEGCQLCAAPTDDNDATKASKQPDEPVYVQNTRLNRSRVKTNGHFSPYVQSRQGSQELSHSPSRLPRPNRNLDDVMTQSCPTPPQSRRKFFLSPKTIRNQWSMRSGSRSPSDNALSVMSASTSTETVTDQRRWSSVVLGKIRSLWSLRDDEGGTVKPRGSLNQRSCNSDTLYTRLGLLLSRDSNSRSFTEDVPLQTSTHSKPVSSNGSPVSTLTGSSETEHKAIKEQSSDSIGSLMSMSGQSNGSSSPLARRHSVTTLQAGSVDDLRSFKTRRQPIRRSARSGTIKGPIDPKVRFAQYRTSPQQQQQHQQQLVLKPLFFEVPQQESDPLFLGREWLVQDINNALQQSQSSGVVVTGLPGTGKTAFVLQLVEHSCFGRMKSNLETSVTNGMDKSPLNVSQTIISEDVKSLASRVVAYHFCQADNNSTCLIPEFVHSLAAQLCQAPQLNIYRQHVLTELNLQDSLSMRECIVDPDSAFTRGVLEPLNTLSRLANTIGTDSLVVVIDGLCEAEYHRPDHGDTIASFLVKHLSKFPTWLKVITTLRTNLEEALPPLPLAKICMDINSSNRENVVKDMMEYIGFRVTNSASIQNNLIAGSTGQLKFCQHLQTSSCGSFLFAKLTLDLIERGHLVAKSQSFKVLPVTLAQIYQLHFNLRFPTTSSFEKIADILSVCLAALYPLTILEIYYSVNSLNVDEFISWEAFLQRFKLISGLLIKRMDNTYMFFHPSFREWLIRRDDSESKKFVCDLRNGHSGIALRFSRLQAPLDSEKTLELGHHVLKAHLYKNMTLENPSPRDLQANWMATVSCSASSALCAIRNIYAPNIKVSRLLLLAGASPDVQTDLLGQAPALCVYAHEGVYDMVALLLEFGASLNVSNSQGRTPLWMAASRGHIDVVKLLTEAGASPGLTDSARRCPLVEAAKNGHFNVVAFLLGCEWTVTNPRVEVDHVDASQQALVQAAGQGVDEIVEYLLDVAEVTADGQDSLSGETALTLASSNGHKSTVLMLLDRGAQVLASNMKCMNALVLAARDGQWEVVDTLLLRGTHVDIVDSEERTALMMAASEDHSNIVELLLDNGADLSAEDQQGQTSLSWACLKGRVAIAQYLLERGAPLNHADKSGKTALDLATLNGNPALVQLLLERGALIEHVDLYGMRPLDRAISCRNVPVVQNFLRRGAKLGPTTWNMATGKPDIMLVLLNKLLEDGNTLYRKGRLKEAAYRYTYALNKFPREVELDSTFKQLQINFYLNTSRCKRKLNEVEESVVYAEKVLKLKPTSFEAYYARAKALKDMRRFEDSLADIQEAVRLVPSGNSDIRHVLFRLKEDIQNKLALDQIALNKEIAGPSYL